MTRLSQIQFLVVILSGLVFPWFARAGDWPASRYDAQRSAASPDELPAQLRLLWQRSLPRLKPAWPDQPKMQFDAAYDPIVLGQRLFVGSPLDDSVTAFDTRTGEVLWRFFADGPVRFAPVAWQDKLYFVSDDGSLYCLRANDGSLLWRVRGGPSERKILGNERLISMWPARGAPVIADGKIYFAAGIWPFMGIFLHAVDATTGRLLWTNDGEGSRYMKQPHNSDSFAGVAPQGALLAIGSKLLVPGGRSVPACFDRSTGRMLYYQLAEHGKRGGGSSVAATEQFLFNGGAVFELETEKYLGTVGEPLAFAQGTLFDYRNGTLYAQELASAEVKIVDSIDRKGVLTKGPKWTMQESGKAAIPQVTALMKSGSRLYVSSPGRMMSLSLPLPSAGEAKFAWSADIEGTPTRLIAADNKLFGVTLEGRLYCFGEAKTAPTSPRQHGLTTQPLVADAAWSNRATEILKFTHVDQGYCLAWGVGTGGLVRELARQSKLRMVVVEPDSSKAKLYRELLRGFGLSERVSVIVADLRTVSLPPYLASLIVTESLPPLASQDRARFLKQTFAALRPYGGVACLPIPAEERAEFATVAEASQLKRATWRHVDAGSLLVREGALPDSANWTHEHADAANTRVSKDKLVRAPLGLLWFGGSSNDAILPRHGHGPQPQVVDGRLFIEGVDLMRAMDIYTGRVLWEAPLPGVGALYDNTAHQPGANASGTNFIASSDGVYVAYRKACVKLDPATGKRLAEFTLPISQREKSPPLWGYLNVDGGYLIGGADPVFDPTQLKNSSKLKDPGGDDDDKKPSVKIVVADVTAAADKAFKGENDNYSSSKRLVVMDRRNGQVLWTATARNGFRHNAICLGGGRIYCIDRASGAEFSRLKRRGEKPMHEPRLVVFDLQTGKELWSSATDVFGTWLSYSTERDVLVEAGRSARDTLGDEPKGMRTYAAKSGNVLWSNKDFSGPALIHHDSILMATNACNLLTGKPRLRVHPLSGEPVEWTWSRNYGCNTPMASEHLLMFRSGAAGYFDFRRDGGTGNFGGFRSSCTNNLIVAGGVLTAPDYTRTCTCSYQNQTSLALVHMPDVETWTSFGSQTPKEPLRRVGINLGAPGDRKADDGTLWLEYPSVGGSSPAVAVTIVPEKPEWFRRHSSQIGGKGLNWVAASGAKGLTSLKIKLGTSNEQPRQYRLRLHFMEPDDVHPGDRLFDVLVQGQRALSSLDVMKESGGQNRALVKEVPGIQVGDQLVIEFTPTSSKRRESILCGVEIHAENW